MRNSDASVPGAVLTRAMWAIRSRIRLLDQSRSRKRRKLEASRRFNFQQTMRQVAARSLSPVGPLLVVPWHKLHEGRAQSDTSLGVKDARPDRYTKAEAILTTLIRLCAWIIRLIITWNLQQSHWKTTQTFGIGTWKSMAVSFPFSSGRTFPTAL